ncbi:LysE/ArgO family amino acid transporter [Agromyces aurantiacus]|uniref:LysE/ArgO family amino acid transporter n=1 Tax=Agromyces aurantiacus TaxID=165814 RepID=A0ABV9R3H3_9MICO|nr:LysE/ArgO family amino acid transporter [Agromyces aurantiacus]MBM7503363.1 L-lysine exporter family protein LysE/ArgO [Agromyces aurantiacus]
MDFSALLAGLGLGFSLIVAIGAQNVFVLRQGIRREHVLIVAAICTASDAALILAGVGGMGAALNAAPWLVGVARWAGAAFLVGYAFLAARRALRGSESGLAVSSEDQQTGGAPGGAGRGGGASSPATGVLTRPAVIPVVLTCLALTWLNPHVYLDTVVLLGSVGATHGDQRWVFAAGAILASAVWFFSLAYGARLLGRVLASPRSWRILDGVIAVVMLAIAVSLVLPA